MSIWLWVHGYAAGHPSRSPIDGRCRASASQAVSYRWSACVWLNAAADLIRARNENTKSTYNDQPSHKARRARTRMPVLAKDAPIADGSAGVG